MPQLHSRLLLVTDRSQTNDRSLLSVLSQAVAAGVSSIHLRERDLTAKDLLALARDVQGVMTQSESQLIVNDRIDVALSMDKAGVHLRSTSLPVAVARRLLGRERLLGVSVHSVHEAIEAEKNGADYIVLGPIFDTPSKQSFGSPLGLSSVEETCRAVRVPVLGIGGVNAARAREVRRAGAFGVAVISAILSADDVETATRMLLDSLGATS